MNKLLGGLCLLPMACIIVFIIYHSADGDLMSMLYIVLFLVGIFIVALITAIGLSFLGIIDD